MAVYKGEENPESCVVLGDAVSIGMLPSWTRRMALWTSCGTRQTAIMVSFPKDHTLIVGLILSVIAAPEPLNPDRSSEQEKRFPKERQPQPRVLVVSINYHL